MTDLQKHLTELGEGLAVPGVAVGMLLDGLEEHAFHGVTSLENPLPVDEHTLFQFGSTGKTYTATAIMALVHQGRVALDEKVRTYLPDFKLKDEDVAREVTVLHLLNHTAGWSGDVLTNTGDGDDALQKYVDLLADVDQVSPLGTAVSYNNASLSVAGSIIARLTGKTYEQGMRELVLDPLGMNETLFFPNEIMTRRFAVGHNQHPDGRIETARPWALPRGNNPAGGMSATSRDQIRWAKFHLGDGSPLMSQELLDLMKQPTFDMRGSALGDYVGISWLMRDVNGVRFVGHGGDTNGQHSHFLTIPERNFALSIMTNCGPNGSQLMDQLEKWILDSYLGIVEDEPEAVKLPDEALAEYVGTYKTVAVSIEITAQDGWLLANAEIDPEVWKQISDDEMPDQPPIPLGLIEGPGDRYVVPEGEGKGMKGYFSRDEAGKISGVHLGGRLATRG